MCFVRISFNLLLIEWSEMDLNVKPESLVETFDQANYNSILEYIVALITLLTYPVSTCTAECCFSGMKRLQTPLRRTMTDERLSSLSILHIHKYKDVTDIDGIITAFACLKGNILPFACNVLDGVTVLPFFTVNRLYLANNTRDRWVK